MAVIIEGNDSHLQPEIDFGTKRQVKAFVKSQQLLDEGAERKQSRSSRPLQRRMASNQAGAVIS